MGSVRSRDGGQYVRAFGDNEETLGTSMQGASGGNFIPRGPCRGEGRRGGYEQVPRLGDEPQVTQHPGKK